MKTRCIGVCLLLAGNATATLLAPGTERPKSPHPSLSGSNWLISSVTASEQETERLREELKNPKKLRELIRQGTLFGYGTPANAETVEAFKRKYGVSDKIMQKELIDLIREWSPKGWHTWQGPDAPLDVRMSYVLLAGATRWLGFCAEAEGKKLLMDIIMDSKIDGEFRWLAIDSYMRRSDAQERWAALVRFLADDVKPTIQPIFDIYNAAVWEYDRVENDSPKREVIISTVSAALMKETGKNAFERGDKLLAERSKEYAESAQRKAALQRFNLQPEKDTQ